MKTISLRDQLVASRDLRRDEGRYDPGCFHLIPKNGPYCRVRCDSSGDFTVMDGFLSVSLGTSVPIVEGLDKKVAIEVGTDGEMLDMGSWHCGTMHCRAGWAIMLAGELGQSLEKAVGTELAGELIYEASTGRRAPDFFASHFDALADIKRCAELY